MGKKTRSQKTSGQAVLEYVMLLAIVVGAMTFGVQQLRAVFDKMMLNFGGIAEKQLRTGAGTANLWTK